jgi:hypothetical protein
MPRAFTNDVVYKVKRTKSISSEEDTKSVDDTVFIDQQGFIEYESDPIKVYSEDTAVTLDENGPMEGILQKKANNLFVGWMKKRVVVGNKALSYFNLKQKNKVQGEIKDTIDGQINFDQYKAEASIKDAQITIRVKGCPRLFVFKATDKLTA